MTLLTANPAANQDGRSEGIPRTESMNGQPPCPSGIAPSCQEAGTGPLVLLDSTPAEPVWVDLRGPDRARLEEVRQVLGFSPEVLTQCLLPARAAKVIPLDSTLFLVTFLGACAPQRLFALRALKICVAPHFALTIHGRSSTALGLRPLCLPDLPQRSTRRTGHLLRLILEGAVQSYETIGAELRQRLPREGQEDTGQTRVEQRLRQQVRGEQFIKFLRHQRTFLQGVVRLGGTLFDADDRTGMQWLAERVGVLVRRVGEVVRAPQDRQDGGGLQGGGVPV